jgi:pyrimidine deaminase RibD-like protein
MSPKDKTMTDEDYMRLALKLGHSQMGRTSPNPAVGCVIVREGVIIAEGKTGEGGRPHVPLARTGAFHVRKGLLRLE